MKINAIGLVLIMLLNSCPVGLFAQTAVKEKEYFIEAGDVLNINVVPAEEFSKEVTVQPDGTIEIPLIGSFKVAGMRVDDLEKLMTAKFSKYVSNPAVTINVRKFSASKIAVIGEVRVPGYFEYREGMKLLDLVAQAGGLADYARTDRVRIFRRIKDVDGKTKEEVLKADLESVMEGKMDKNIVLAVGDIVYVPRKKYSTVSKWITDNFVPWATLATFAITVGIVSRKN